MSSTTAASQRLDRWVIARHRTREDVGAVLSLWVIFSLFVFAVVLLVAAFRTIEVSGWEIGSQIPRWFAGGLGVYLSSVYLPLYVAHGRTRRDVAVQCLVSALVTAVVMAMLMTLGYVIERGIYAIAGWPQALGSDHLYATATDYPLILLDFLLLFVAWKVAGIFAGAAFYRSPTLGFVTLPIVVVVVGLAEATRSPGFLEIAGDLVSWLQVVPDVPSAGASIVITLVGLVVMLPAAWLVVRDLPLRNEPA